MKCPNCGKNIKDRGVSYCPHCGQSLGNIDHDLREVTKLQIEYQEAKGNARGWGIGGLLAAILGLVCVFAIPFTFFLSLLIAIPCFILAIVGSVLTFHYDGKAKKLKDEL